MCGIGVIYSPQKGKDQREQIARRMMKSLIHRGPDAQELWSNEKGLTLLHTRLAIMDLSPTGRQPMSSASGRWTIVFNGEIYNHPELRKKFLPSHSFRGSSDTETLLELFDLIGPEEAIKKVRGMFAIAAYNSQTHELFIFRDRIGEKPLYYGRVGHDFILSSELKGFFSHSEFKPQIDLQSLALYLQFNHVPQPHSIFLNIKKLPQASFVKISLSELSITEPQVFWSLPLSKISAPEPKDWQNSVHQKLKEVVQIQMRSDVPYGCFLSGGVDSSTIAALMQTQSQTPIRTFAIGFDESQYNEAPFARQVAQHLGTQHDEWILSSQEAKNVIPLLATIYDEPFADSSQIPTYLLSKMTRTKVTVSLSGDGGDELFSGYNRYTWTTKIWALIGWMPLAMRKNLSRLLNHLPVASLAMTYRILVQTLPKNFQIAQVEQKIPKLLKILETVSPRELYFKTLAYWPDPQLALAKPAHLPATNLSQYADYDVRAFMMWHDQTHYLPDDIMVKVDRASMANSLETRAPFLDHELIELVAALPLQLRIGASPKKVLKDILYQYVPSELIERPKMGFGIPLQNWLRKDLKELTLDQLNPVKLKKQNLFNSDNITQILKEFYEEEKPHQDLIWPLLVFQLWYEKWLKN